MKKGFTLVEMLVVVVVLVTLMTIVFRLSTVGLDTEYRSATIDRMQRVENALSGYYAAFGTYPPVKLHGSRNIYLRVSDHGVQNTQGDENTSIWGWINGDGTAVQDTDAEREAWEQVKAACGAQPVACLYPFPQSYQQMVGKVSMAMQSYAALETEKTGMSDRLKRNFSRGFNSGPAENPGAFDQDAVDWQEIQVFKFGLMSFLLPRYLIMLSGDDSIYDDFRQWWGNNAMPSDPLTGSRQSSWRYICQQYIQKNPSSSDYKRAIAHVANIPSQAACARWMANFEKTLTCNHDYTIFGVNVRLPEGSVGYAHTSFSPTKTGENFDLFTPGGYDQDSGANQYILDKISIVDGWGNDYYYYSPAPYQSYRLWSPGPNGRTFPPWISLDSSELDAQAKRCIGYWTKDDIVSLRD